MTDFRVIASGWYQVPLLYVPHDLVGEGRLEQNGNGAGSAVTAAEPSTAA